MFRVTTLPLPKTGDRDITETQRRRDRGNEEVPMIDLRATTGNQKGSSIKSRRKGIITEK